MKSFLPFQICGGPEKDRLVKSIARRCQSLLQRAFPAGLFRLEYEELDGTGAFLDDKALSNSRLQILPEDVGALLLYIDVPFASSLFIFFWILMLSKLNLKSDSVEIWFSLPIFSKTPESCAGITFIHFSVCIFMNTLQPMQKWHQFCVRREMW